MDCAEPITIHRGDLYWIAASESRGVTAGLAHPHLVVQENVFNHSRINTVIVCALTSNLKRANEPGNILLDEREGNLSRRSVLVVSQILSLAKTDLGEYIGELSQERVDRVLSGLRFQQASFFRR